MEGVGWGGGGWGVVRGGETGGGEMRVCFQLQQDVISECEQDNSSLVLRAKCVKPGLPNQDIVYAMKFLSDYVHGTTQTEVCHSILLAAMMSW